LLNYIKTLHTGSTICLRVQGGISDPICGNRGTRQGAPVCATISVKNGLGSRGTKYKTWGQVLERINHLAFADDVVIFAATDLGLQHQINHLQKEQRHSGLTFNPEKCSSFRLKIDGKKK